MVRCLIGMLLTLITALPASGADESADVRLRKFFDEQWQIAMRENPVWASSLGDRRYNDRWPDLSLEHLSERQQQRESALDKLSSIPRDQLSRDNQLNYDLFLNDLKEDIQEFKFNRQFYRLNQRDGIQTEDDTASTLRFETVKDYEDWLGRMEKFPTMMDQTIALLRAGVQARVLHPKVIMQRVPAQIDKQIVDDPTASGFYKPFKKFPNNFSEADRDRLTKLARERISQQIVPSYRKFKQFFVEEYLPASLPEVGVWQIPEGEPLYAFLVKQHTTTDMTPDEVHELGLKEVARIRAEMEKIKSDTGFKGSLDEFFNYLRTDPKFFYKTGEELLEATRAMCKRIDPKLTKLFKTIPRMPYGVEPIPMNIAPDTTTAYYQQPAADGSRAGTYYVNLYKPESRPKWEMMALTLHEAVPGHHFQIARAMELGEMPEFRRYGRYTAYVEGWGLYAEHLGDDIGMYEDPYDRMGKLTYEMWRAVRLVVDTGIHHKRWTRQQAIDFFKQNAPKSELDIINEIDRYIAWPGQALAYKVGELKIKEIRRNCEAKWGDKFDLREFHDALLNTGPVPLHVLEKTMEQWKPTTAGR